MPITFRSDGGLRRKNGNRTQRTYYFIPDLQDAFKNKGDKI